MVSASRTLDFQQIHSFLAVVRAGGITAAARRLGLAKSAVSKHVSQLEAVVGVKLLERSSRRVSLTRAGEHLLGRFESLVAEGERLVEQARDEHDRVEGLVRIAATPDFGGLVAERFFPRVIERHPELQLVVDPAYAFADLQDPAFDLAFRIGSVHDDRLVARELGRYRRILVASATYLRAHPTRRPRDLDRRNALVFSGERATAAWTLVHRRSGATDAVEVHGKLAAKSWRILLTLAEHGAGIAMVPDFLVVDALADGRLERVLPTYASRPTSVYLTYRVGSDRIRRIRTVRDLALEHLPALLARPTSRSSDRHARG
jgi:molybdate transport repressor ModE-like protein